MKPLKGIHHVTAITSSAQKIYDFFTNILGLRLVKKTVNQDDIHTYHLFFADDLGQAGTDMTFFDFKGIQKKVEGTNEITQTGFRVPSDEALEYYVKRFNHYGISYEPIRRMFNINTLKFKDFDDQYYVLFSDQNDQGVPSGKPWQKGPVPLEYAITGLGPIFLTVSDQKAMHNVLENVLTFKLTKKENHFYLYETGMGGNGASVILIEDQHSKQSQMGYGGIHHVAFRVDDQDDLLEWSEVLKKRRAPQSGLVDRFYFKSLYTRLYPQILFEFATEGPGFIDDQEDYDILGETLALPPRFRGQEEQIKKLIEPIDTERSNKSFKKEYF